MPLKESFQYSEGNSALINIPCSGLCKTRMFYQIKVLVYNVVKLVKYNLQDR